ncbi:MAG: DUF721 domain-containing protein [Candidatus Gastranaerophilales bacterium]|nr:DUF721 domain-containing protein [Candidatus Gastranaerophilales bacterium]
MKKHNPTTHIGELISKTAFGEMAKGNKMGAVIKHSTIFSFWNNIVGVKFAKFTKPYSIKYNKLYVSAKSPVIVQELNLYKTKILKNVNSYSMPLGITITDIIFNYKNYCVSTPSGLSNQVEDKPIEITKTQLESIELDKKTQEQIKENVDRIKFLNDEQKANFARKIESTYKAKNLQQD